MDLVISVFLFALQSDGENFRLAYSLLLELLSQFLLGFAEKRNIEWKIIQSSTIHLPRQVRCRIN